MTQLRFISTYPYDQILAVVSVFIKITFVNSPNFESMFQMKLIATDE